MSDGSTKAQYLTASLEQQGDDGALRVVIGQNETLGVAATRDEARRFALAILALLDGPLTEPEGASKTACGDR